jgi:hypothetical protein
MAFKIGTVESIGDPENWSEDPKDRIIVTQCINGSYVEDNGIDEEDAVISCTITVTEQDYQTLLNYRISRTPVDITTHRGIFMQARKFKITKISYIDGAAFRSVGIEIYNA